MKHFTDELEDRLRHAANQQAARGPLQRAARTVATVPTPASGLAVAAVAAAALSAGLIASGTGDHAATAAAFPILDRPAVDATGRKNTAVLRRAGANLRQTRTFETPYGTGYVAEAPGGRLCISVPDRAAGSVAGTCRPVAQAKAAGLWVTLIGTAGTPDASSEFVAILPAGAPAPRVVNADGTESDLPVVDGVVATKFTESVKVKLTGGGRTSTVPVELIPNSRGGAFDCHGKIVRGPSREAACG